MQTSNLNLARTCDELMSDQLEQVNGAGPNLGPVDVGTAAQMGIEGSIKALNQSDAPGWSGFSNAISQFNQNYNPVYWGLSAANNYFNPSPGNGAPGDTYIPATANSDGSITGGSFMAP